MTGTILLLLVRLFFGIILLVITVIYILAHGDGHNAKVLIRFLGKSKIGNLVSITLVPLGVVLAVLGYIDMFSFRTCVPDLSNICYRVATLDTVAILGGEIAVLTGVIGISYRFLDSRA